LKFPRDRRRWRHWLFEARRRYGLSVLNYVATSNHIHLLCADRGNDEIPRSMQLIAGRTAQEYNMRKSRKGAFWEDRYHATIVQTDGHLARCITYIDLNMVRAGAVAHPREWEVGGYKEIQALWQRKGVIDFATLMHLLDADTHEALVMLVEKRVAMEVARTRREPAWSEAIAVGDDAFLAALKDAAGIDALDKRIVSVGGFKVLRGSTSR